jgi:hypothetical protein
MHPYFKLFGSLIIKRLPASCKLFGQVANAIPFAASLRCSIFNRLVWAAALNGCSGGAPEVGGYSFYELSIFYMMGPFRVFFSRIRSDSPG